MQFGTSLSRRRNAVSRHARQIGYQAQESSPNNKIRFENSLKASFISPATGFLFRSREGGGLFPNIFSSMEWWKILALTDPTLLKSYPKQFRSRHSKGGAQARISL